MRRSDVWLACALAIVGIVYANAIQAPFVRDDHLLIAEEPRVQELRPVWEYFAGTYWSNPSGPTNAAYYRPLTTLSFAIDYQIWSGAASGFHATNVIFHLGCVLLVFALARRGGAAPLAAALAAALFGTFPRLTEAVTWISGRTDVLATLGALGGLLLHRSEERRHGARAAAAVLVLAGLLCKEVAAAGGVAIVALELERRRRERWPWRRTLVQVAPVALAGALYCGLRFAAGMAGAFPDIFGWPLRILLFMQALGTYALMLLDPLRPRLLIGKLGLIQVPFVLLGVVSMAGVGLLTARIVRRQSRPHDTSIFLLGLAALVPVLHLVALPVRVVAADRFLFLPAAALAVGLASASRALPRHAARRTAVLALCVLPLFGVSTHLRNRLWQDELELWTAAVENAPVGSSEAHRELATVLSWRGENERALEYFMEGHSRAWDFARRYPKAGVDQNLRSNLALVLSELGRNDEAVVILEGLLREQPRNPANHVNLAAVHARKLDFDEAEAGFAAALELFPEYTLAKRMKSQVQKARLLWQRLPPEREPALESVDVNAARAYTAYLVGRLDEAERRWTHVAAAPDASLDHIRRAVRYLVLHARDLDATERALERLRAADQAVPELGSLDRKLHERREDSS